LNNLKKANPIRDEKKEEKTQPNKPPKTHTARFNLPFVTLEEFIHMVFVYRLARSKVFLFHYWHADTPNVVLSGYK
jgi:hypothetical protein